MSEQELAEIRRAILATRPLRTSSQEKAREFLRDEGVISQDGKLAEEYTSDAA